MVSVEISGFAVLAFSVLDEIVFYLVFAAKNFGFVVYSGLRIFRFRPTLHLKLSVRLARHNNNNRNQNQNHNMVSKGVLGN